MATFSTLLTKNDDDDVSILRIYLYTLAIKIEILSGERGKM